MVPQNLHNRVVHLFQMKLVEELQDVCLFHCYVIVGSVPQVLVRTLDEHFHLVSEAVGDIGVRMITPDDSIRQEVLPISSIQKHNEVVDCGPLCCIMMIAEGHGQEMENRCSHIGFSFELL